MKRGVARRSEQIANRLLGRLADSARLLSLSSPEGWHSPYAIGFAWRHVFLAHEMARHEQILSWFIQRDPGEDQRRWLFMAVVPNLFGLEREHLEHSAT